MPIARPSDEWCRRLGDALVDGRFLEDPSLWEEHRRNCADCDVRVRGLLHLRALIDESRSESSSIDSSPADAAPAVVLARVTERLRRHRGRRRIQWMVGIGLAMGLGATELLRTPKGVDSTTAETQGSMARQLLDRIVRSDGTLDFGQVATDSRFEAECRAALTSPAPSDRQVAFMILALGRRPLDAEVTARLLRDARPHLDRPIELASEGASAELMAAALAEGRTATLVTVLGALPGTLIGGGESTSPEVIEPFLRDASAEVRKLAIVALGFHPKYRPTELLWTVLRSDPATDVRAAAAVLLVRSGAAERVAAHFSDVQDYAAEEFVATTLGFGPRAQVLGYGRVADSRTPLRLGLRHALRLLRAHLPFDRSRLLVRAFAATDHAADDLLTECAAAGDWAELRLALQERWRTSPAGYARERVAAGLASWDVRSGVLGRFALALELLEQDMSQSAIETAVALRGAADLSISRRAAAVLESWERRSGLPSSSSKE